MPIYLINQVFDEHVLDFVTTKKLVFLIEHLLYGVGETFEFSERALRV
jgi:hypothetical protein